VRNFRVIKPEIRVLGVDDGGFVPHVKGLVPVVGVVFRGGYWLDGVMSTAIEVDGLDATEKIATMVVDSPHFRQVRVIMLNGVTFAGFNVVDVQALNGLTGLPVVAVTREKPDLGRIKQALEKLPLGEKRWSLILKAGEVHEVSVGRGKKRVYLHATGISVEDAGRIVRLTSTRSNVPEALRVAHMVASGISHV
jgi:endonuclease V-like protein UPF0215 family